MAYKTMPVILIRLFFFLSYSKYRRVDGTTYIDGGGGVADKSGGGIL